MNHYHIRWDNSKVDWQAFRTKDEAVADAERLKRLDENYNIEERDGNCERCLRLPNTRIAETGNVDGSEPGRNGRNGVQN
jgi:hypothetical protein